MLKITIPASELFDEATSSIITVKEQKLQLEHSLVSISKWESKWEKPFLSREPKTDEEFDDYIRCMTLTQNVNPSVYWGITPKIRRQVSDYIDAPMTATTFSDTVSRPSREIITAEVIYYWMIALEIPFECQKWHLNRLITLIKVCNAKNKTPKKMSRRDLANRNRQLNESRKRAHHTRG